MPWATPAPTARRQPSWAFHLAAKKAIQNQVSELRIAIECLLDLAEKHAPNDAAAAPHQGNGAIIDRPARFVCHGVHERETLGIRDNFAGIKRILDVADQRVSVAHRPDLRAAQHARRGHALVLLRGQAAGQDRLADQRERNAQVQRRDHGPFPRSLLPGRVEDQIDKRLLRLGVAVGEDVAGDLDQVAIQPALVPAIENVVQRVSVKAAQAGKQVVGFADQLNIAIFDAVVDHLDVVSRPLVADPVAAGRAIGRLGGDGLEDRFDMGPGRGIAARHDGRAPQRPFLAARDARANVEQAPRLERPRTPRGVGVMRVAAVDQDVARLQKRRDFLDHLVHGRAGLHHHHHLARPLERRDQFIDGMTADDVFALGPASDEIIHAFQRTIENRHGKTVALHVEH
jgi:hypothetical protein